jgi:hypothetical protein
MLSFLLEHLMSDRMQNLLAENERVQNKLAHADAHVAQLHRELLRCHREIDELRRRAEIAEARLSDRRSAA